MGGNIRSVFLYHPDRVSLVGSVSTAGDDFSTTTFKNTRLPLVVTFDFNGKNVTLVHFHLASQAGSSEQCASIQPPINHGGTTKTVNNRIAQAPYISDYVKRRTSADPDAKVGILGDFNDVSWSEANQVYMRGGLNDLEDLEAPKNRYIYNFKGNSEALDHTIGTTTFYDASNFQTVHINFEYQSDERESDHDPSVTRLDLATYVVAGGQSLNVVSLADR